MVYFGGPGRLQEIKGGADAGRRFIDALELFYHVANIGDARSLLPSIRLRPRDYLADLTPEEQLKTGVTDNSSRLSVGLEHIDDILGDLRQALDTGVGAKKAAEYLQVAGSRAGTKSRGAITA